jgi:hypothetical protein
VPDLGGGYQMNPQLAQVKADQAGDTRATPEEAGYMELDGARKDSDCVLVSGGVSSQKGCCNLWDSVPGAQAFSCGTCTKIKGQTNSSPVEGNAAPVSSGAASPGTSQQ